jgi:hypothetical protein
MSQRHLTHSALLSTPLPPVMDSLDNSIHIIIRFYEQHVLNGVPNSLRNSVLGMCTLFISLYLVLYLFSFWTRVIFYPHFGLVSYSVLSSLVLAPRPFAIGREKERVARASGIEFPTATSRFSHDKHSLTSL